NSRQLNVVARAILIQPDLVNLWKEIGYYEICCDFNEYVMPRVFYMLFPSNTPNDWKYPDENAIVDLSLIFKSSSTNSTENSTKKEVNNIITAQNHSEKNEITTNNASLIQLVRQQRQKQLEETVLIRKAAHRSLTSHYEQEHLPLSQIQEKLEEENLPLIQVQHQLKQQKDDSIIYTATKENLKSLFFNQRTSYNLLTRLKKSKRTMATSSVTGTTRISNNNTIDNFVDNNDKDDRDNRDYDVWDDAVIGRIMNLIDTIGLEPIQGTHQEVGSKNFTSFEISSENVTEKNGSKGNSKSKNPMNLQENSQCEINLDEIISDNAKFSSNESEERDNAVTSVTSVNTLQNKDSGNLIRDSGYGEKSMSIVDNKKRQSGFFGKRRSIPSSNNEITNSQEKNSVKPVKPFYLTLRRNLSRRKSLRLNNNSAIDIIEPEEDEFNNTNSRNKFFTIPKRITSTRQFNKSLQALRKSWKTDQQKNDDDYQFKENLSDRELNQLMKSQQNNNSQ
ncbi:10060_t:CDS:2, partial [Funneliformis geosporum]